MEHILRSARKAAAVVTAAALLTVAPGLGAWEAVAQVVPIHVQAPVGGMSAAGVSGAAVRTPGAAPVSPAFSLPVMGLPGLAPTAVPDARLNAPTLPASAIPGVRPAADPFARFAEPGPIAVEGRWTPPPGPGGAEAVAAAAHSGVSAGGTSLSPLELPDVAADGLPASLGESIGSFRGKTNALGRQFSALRAAFGMRADADVAPVNGVKGELRGPAETAPSFAGSVASFLYRPISAARTGLSRLIAVGRQAAPPQAPPAPLTLTTSADGLRIAIAEKGKNAVTAEDAPAPAPATEAPKPAPPGQDKSWFGLGKMAMMFIASLVVAQVGVEALGAAMPTLVQKTFGDFTAVAQLAIFSSIASIVGRQLGPMAVRRFGLKNAYLGASGLRLVSISLLAGLLATGHMTLPLMMLFYSINGFLSGISLTAMESIPPALVGQNQARIEKFWAWEQTILEIIGIAGPIATGAVVASWGFLPALIAFPVTMAASLAIILMTLRLPKAEPETAAPAAGSAPKHGFWAKVFHGAKLVWGTPVLRTAFLGYTVYMMLNPFLYTMLGPAFGLALLGAENAQAATSVIGWLTGLYSAGGLLGGFMMMWEQKRTAAAKAARRAEHEAKNGKVSDEAWEELAKPWENEVLRKSMLRWMLWGTGGLAAIATLAFPMGVLPLGLTVQALALVPFGIAQVVTVLKLRSFFQSKVPDAKKNMADAMGFFGSASLAVTTAGLLALKYVFQNFAGFAPFHYIALAMLPLAVYYLYTRWRLDRLSRPS